MRKTTYTVDILRSGQPRPYADTDREYLITVEKSRPGKDGMYPWLMHGDVEERTKREEADHRAAGRMIGGMPPDALRKEQRDWALKIVRALCQNFQEKDDDDGRYGESARFYPTLKWLMLDQKKGTIHAFIVEPYKP